MNAADDRVDRSGVQDVPCRQRGRAAGFTLVELLIVVLIVAVAAGLTVPLLAETSTTRLRSAAELLAADLGFAQVASITHGDDRRVVVFDTARNRYHIATASAPDAPLVNPADGKAYRTTFGNGRAHGLAGVSLVSAAVGGDATLGFGLYGELDQTQDATIALRDGGRRITLSVDAVSGEVSIGDIE